MITVARTSARGMFKPDLSSVQGQRRVQVGWDQGPPKALFDPDQGRRGVSPPSWNLVRSNPMDSPTAHEPLSRVRRCLHGLAEIGGFLKAGALAVLEVGLGRWPKAANLDRGRREGDLSGRSGRQTAQPSGGPRLAAMPNRRDAAHPISDSATLETVVAPRYRQSVPQPPLVSASKASPLNLGGLQNAEDH